MRLYKLCEKSGMRSLGEMLEDLKGYYDAADDAELSGKREDAIIEAIRALEDAVACEGMYEGDDADELRMAQELSSPYQTGRI